MTTPDSTATSATPADPALREALMELLGLGARIARVMADVIEIEGRVVAAAAAALPPSVAAHDSLTEAQAAGLAVDGAAAQLADSLPRIATASRSFDRVARAIRRTAALVQRIDCGWSRQGVSDDRQAMARRQIGRSVGEAIARHAQGEAAERLFDDLNDRPEHHPIDLTSRSDKDACQNKEVELSSDSLRSEKALDAMARDGAPIDQPVEAVISAICRDLGLPAPGTPLDLAAVRRTAAPDG